MNSSISRNWASVIRSVGSFLARPIGKIEKSRQWRTPSERSMSRKASSCGTIAPVTQVTTSYDSEGSRTIILEPSEKEDVYYVYAKGRLKSVYTSASAAVKDADENLGVVVDGSMQNIWERGNKETEVTLDISTVPDIMRQCSLDPAAIEEGTGCKALDLSGCTLDSVLYYVSQGTPVVAKTPVTDQTPQGVVLIIGYDEYNTLLVNPGESEFFYYGMNDSTALFEEAGNIFMTYWDPIS